jgi:hypothetical protein
MNKSNHYNSKNCEHGSVLIYILVAIALFAALSFTVSQSQRGGNTKNDELLTLYGSEIMQYTNGLQRAVRTLRIEDVQYDEISFENNVIAGYTNLNCTNDKCKIFHPSGGGMAYQEPLSDEWLDGSRIGETYFGEWYFPGETCVLDVGTDTGVACSSDGTDNEEIIVILPWIKRELCERINRDLGITDVGDPIPLETTLNAWNGDYRKFTGDVGNGERMDQGGRRLGCFAGNGVNTPPANSYHYFQVLWAR